MKGFLFVSTLHVFSRIITAPSSGSIYLYNLSLDHFVGKARNKNIRASRQRSDIYWIKGAIGRSIYLPNFLPRNRI
jgi:hypothetical protein